MTDTCKAQASKNGWKTEAPASFINGELMFYGGVPTVEKFAEVIKKLPRKAMYTIFEQGG